MQIEQQGDLRLWMIIQEKGAEKVGGVWTGIINSLGAKKKNTANFTKTRLIADREPAV